MSWIDEKVQVLRHLLNTLAAALTHYGNLTIRSATIPQLVPSLETA
jgi:hypothetical protein